jgi:hypothetical protein
MDGSNSKTFTRSSIQKSSSPTALNNPARAAFKSRGYEMRIYYGERRKTGAHVYIIESDDPGIHDIAPRQLNPRFDLCIDCPPAFDWGHYNGSGPAQLALCLLADIFGNDEKAQQYYERFKFLVVPCLGENWALSELDIRSVIARLA